MLIFSIKDAENIINETVLGGKTKIKIRVDAQKLMRDLNHGYSRYKGWKQYDNLPTKKKALDKINVFQKKTLEAVRVYRDFDDDLKTIRSFMGTSKDTWEVEDLLDTAINTMEELEETLYSLRDDISDRDHVVFRKDEIKGKKTGERYFIGRILPEIYERQFKRKPGFSRPSGGGDPCGPMFRFIDSCLKIIGLEQKPETIRSAFEACKKSLSKNGKIGIEK